MDDPISRQAAIQPEQQHGRVFKGIVVEYPSYNTYPEYIGKPYFSIKYTENGQEFIGYGTYNPEVLSEYLIEYFMSSVTPEREKGYWKPIMMSETTGWDLSLTGGYDEILEYRCSKCGEATYIDEFGEFILSDSCPHCGADLRGNPNERSD